MEAISRGGFLTLAIMLVHAVPENTGPYQNDEAAYELEDYATALEFRQPLAELGHARAKSNLGIMFGLGEGVSQDFMRAYLWFDIGAAQGDKTAQKGRDLIASKMPPTGSPRPSA